MNDLLPILIAIVGCLIMVWLYGLMLDREERNRNDKDR